MVMNMNFARKTEINPLILRATKFKSTQKTPNSENIKNQYFYRIMLLTQGSATVVTNSFKETLRKNDVLYLLPDTPYKILNSHGEFEVLNIYFDYFNLPYPDNEYVYKTLFQSQFDESKCQKIYHFTDAPKLNSPCIICNNKNIADFAFKIFTEFSEKCENSKKICSLLLNCIVEEICKSFILTVENNDKHSKILNYIKENCDAKICADDLAKKFYYHKNHINRIIKLNTGLTLKEFIIKSKIELADKLFEETNMTTTEIANYLNFFDASHFIKTYKKYKSK